jgi:ethanolamine utilization cobalamin adenosyltransferase
MTLEKGDIVTPSARQYLKERGVKIIGDDRMKNKPSSNKRFLTDQSSHEDRLHKPVKENHYKDFKPMDNNSQAKYVSHYDGGLYLEKPEHMTHIKGNQLVFKDDGRIVFRGRLDSLESLIMEIQIQLLTSPIDELLKNLDEILTIVRNVLRAEVLGEPIRIDTLFGLTDAELREHSHHPKQHYGIEHFLPDISMGKEVIYLNKLRTEIREVELAAMKAFRKEMKVEREDIVQVFNRLSSATYILMCRVRGNYYSKSR